MAWTAPRTFVVGELETAAIFNTHLRDNLKYLHGDSGAFTVNDNLTVSPASGAASVITNAVAGSGSIYYMDKAGSHVWHVGRSGADDHFAITESGIADRLVITQSNNGFVAIGAHTPQGKLHVYDRISGLMKWEYDGVDGTARTVIPDAAGDVLYRIAGISIVRASDGTTQSYSDFGAIGTPTPGGTFDIYSAGAGANKVTVPINANGAVTVGRSAGSLTYKISLLLQWL